MPRFGVALILFPLPATGPADRQLFQRPLSGLPLNVQMSLIRFFLAPVQVPAGATSAL